MYISTQFHEDSRCFVSFVNGGMTAFRTAQQRAGVISNKPTAALRIIRIDSVGTNKIRGVHVVTLYVVRHGETVWNVERRLQGWLDSELTSYGLKSAKLLGVRLSRVEFKSVYSSSSQRAVQTAEAIIGEGRNIVTCDNLREINMGEWEGRTHAEVQREFPDQYDKFWNAPHLYKPQSGESFDQFQHRVVAEVNQIISEIGQGNALIVSHAAAIKAIMAHIKKFPLHRFWEPPILQGTSLSTIEFNEGHSRIVCEGDIIHLEENT